MLYFVLFVSILDLSYFYKKKKKKKKTLHLELSYPWCEAIISLEKFYMKKKYKDFREIKIT